ncbi:hypothetical protein [Shinella granuli]|uniref:Uncharacterized protein n=1 Tax=Shinella granuli TaxID=323621 RepID=A0A4R2CNK9_SHIGR|nr:hypothetical protein [Shinella granuli]TCN42421.1 hypothetical protein EV665_112156 [Shinella granuli]
MSDDDHRKQMVAAAAVAMAQRNIAIAKARYGYQPPERHAAPVASAPAPAQARNDVLVKEAARRRAEREAAEAAETKATMARVVARLNGKEVKDPSRLQHGWDKVVSEFNKRNGAVATEEKPAELSGWAKVVAEMNARHR